MLETWGKGILIVSGTEGEISSDYIGFRLTIDCAGFGLIILCTIMFPTYLMHPTTSRSTLWHETKINGKREWYSENRFMLSTGVSATGCFVPLYVSTRHGGRYLLRIVNHRRFD